MNADELDIAESTGLLYNDPVVKDQPEIPFCGCLSVRYYQPFFDVDTSDVMTRIGSAVFYCNRDQTFLSLVGDKPDAYGPFWVKLLCIQNEIYILFILLSISYRYRRL